VGKFGDTKSYLEFVQPVNTTVAVFPQRSSIAVKYKTCPVEIYIGVFKLAAGKYSTLESGDDGCAVLTEEFQKVALGFVCERRKAVSIPGCRAT